MRTGARRLTVTVSLALLGCSQSDKAAPMGGGGSVVTGGAGTPAAGGATGTGGSLPIGGSNSAGGTVSGAGAGTVGGAGMTNTGGALAGAGSGGVGGNLAGQAGAAGDISSAGLSGIGGGAATAGSGGSAGTASSAGSAGAAGAAGAGGAAAGAGGAAAGAGGKGTVSPPFRGSFHMGADITWVQHDEAYGATYVDTDGVTKDILALLKNHGFNSIRLRSYVDPRAADGYDKVDGFGDLAHTVAMAQRVKNAGMGLLISFHLSDNWADPGKQCIPVAWQGSTLAQLAAHVHDYLFAAVTALKSAGATPELVQIGNEITPGLLIHICDSEGQRVSTAPVNGSTSNWANTGTILKEGIRAVKEVDSNIKTVLHIDKGGDVNASVSWIRNAQNQNVQFDVFADTAYVRWQGQPSGWQNTFNTLASTFPNLSFIIPEYANETATSPATPSTMRLASDTVFNIAGNRGVGAWIYEPTHPVQAGVGVGLFVNDTSGGTLADAWPTFVAAPSAMAVYDQMRTAYASRL